MNTKETLRDYARILRMPVLRDDVDDLIAQATEEHWDYRTLLCNVCGKEVEHRNENGRRERIRRAGFPQLLYLADLERDALPEDGRFMLPQLETLDFIREGRNVVLYGNPGTGKTHTAIGLGIKACGEGNSVLFTSVPHLLTQIRECRSERTLGRLESRFEHYDLVICDEFGYVSCDKEGGELLFNHLSLRAGKKATIITTNLAFDRWNEIIQDEVLITAMVDRLTHKAHLVNMTGLSYRVRETEKMNAKDNDL